MRIATLCTLAALVATAAAGACTLEVLEASHDPLRDASPPDGRIVDADLDACGGACTPPACGNGTVEPPEQCDDGNRVDGDGCSAACTTTARWQGPELVGQGTAPAVAITPAGDLLVAWSTAQQIWVRRRAAIAGAWEPPRTLTDGARTVGSPRLAVDDHGDAVVAWTTARGQPLGVAWARAGGVWSPLATPAGDADVQRVVRAVALGPDATIVVGWDEVRAGAPIVPQVGVRRPDGAWAAIVDPASVTTTGARLALAVGSVGASLPIVAAWEVTVGDRVHVHANVLSYTPTTGVVSSRGEVRLDRQVTGDAIAPRVGLDAAGRATVVYALRDAAAGVRGFEAARFTASWSAPVAVTPPALVVPSAAFAVDRDGGALVMYAGACTPACALAVTRFDAGAWQPPVELAAIERAPLPAALAVDGGRGLALLGLREGDEPIASVWGVELAGGGGSAPHALEDDHAVEHGGLYDVAFRAGTGGIAAWVRAGATPQIVVARARE